MRYQDKVVIVTGGSRGIGEGCVRVFVEAGAKVVFCSRADEEGRRLEGEFPGRAVFFRADVSKTDEVNGLIDEAVKRFGRLDCLINNAGWTNPRRVKMTSHTTPRAGQS